MTNRPAVQCKTKKYTELEGDGWGGAYADGADYASYSASGDVAASGSKSGKSGGGSAKDSCVAKTSDTCYTGKSGKSGGGYGKAGKSGGYGEILSWRTFNGDLLHFVILHMSHHVIFIAMVRLVLLRHREIRKEWRLLFLLLRRLHMRNCKVGQVGWKA